MMESATRGCRQVIPKSPGLSRALPTARASGGSGSMFGEPEPSQARPKPGALSRAEPATSLGICCKYSRWWH
ncbi:hypothetical protein WG66_003949, partial [Moniliophthora roreri]